MSCRLNWMLCLAIGALGFESALSQQTVEPSKDSSDQSVEISLPKLRLELLDRVKRDQELRNKMMSEGGRLQPDVIRELRAIDEENRKWLKKQVDQQGWLGASKVGTDGAHAAWLLVQHADPDPKFQRRCLELMKAMEEGEVSDAEVAYLTDRVLLAEGKPQRYGTQFEFKNGQPVMKECEEPESLDQRRESVGLGSIEEYRKKIAEAYGQIQGADKKKK